MNICLAFVCAAIATCGFCILFHVPVRNIPIASIIGGLGWIIYQAVLNGDGSVIEAAFISSCAVSFCSDISARVFKQAATVFIIPGILPLVPGAGIYYTLQAFITSNMALAATKGTDTLLVAGAIALGLLITGAVLRVIVEAYRRIKNLILSRIHRHKS